MSKPSRRQAADRPWYPTDPKQILIAVVLVLAVGGAIVFVMRYQASQPKPLPKSVYENMYKSMYGREAGQAGAPQQGSKPAVPPGAPQQMPNPGQGQGAPSMMPPGGPR